MHMLGPNATRHMRARTTAHRRCAFSYAEGQKDLPARGHRENVSGMAFSHRLHDRAAQQLGRSAWLRQRFHARNVYSRSAPTGWRELCRHTATRYWPKACVRSNTTARASYHTRLPSFKRLAIALVGYQVGVLVTQTMKPAVRGARGKCLQTTCRPPSMCSPQRPQRPPPVVRCLARGVRRLGEVFVASRRNHEITASSENMHCRPTRARESGLRKYELRQNHTIAPYMSGVYGEGVSLYCTLYCTLYPSLYYSPDYHPCSALGLVKSTD